MKDADRLALLVAHVYQATFNAVARNSWDRRPEALEAAKGALVVLSRMPSEVLAGMADELTEDGDATAT